MCVCLVVTQPTKPEIFGGSYKLAPWLVMPRQAKDLLHKGPTVLGAQAFSPARVQRNQLSQWLLVRRDTGRRGRLRSQDRGAFVQDPIKHSGHNSHPRSPHLFCSNTAAAIAAVSARRIRPPSVTICHPQFLAAINSSSVQPPSDAISASAVVG